MEFETLSFKYLKQFWCPSPLCYLLPNKIKKTSKRSYKQQDIACWVSPHKRHSRMHQTGEITSMSLKAVTWASAQTGPPASSTSRSLPQNPSNHWQTRLCFTAGKNVGWWGNSFSAKPIQHSPLSEKIFGGQVYFPLTIYNKCPDVKITVVSWGNFMMYIPYRCPMPRN